MKETPRHSPAENRADLARVLLALALLAWLSSWDGSREEPRRDNLAQATASAQ